MSSTRIWIVGVFCLTIGCAPSDRDQESGVVEQWRLRSAPTWVVGRDPTDTVLQFTRISSLTFLSDTLVAIGHSSHPPTVFLIDLQGRLVGRLGRDGRGPGELGTVSQVWSAPPDTVIVYDFWRRRLTWFTTDGATVRTTRLTDDAFLNSRWLLRGRFADGSYLARRNAYLDAATGAAGRTTDVALRVRGDGSVIDTIGLFPGVDFKENARGQPAALHFGAWAAFLAAGSYLWTGFPDSFTIRAYALNGHLVRTFHRPSRARRITSTMVAQLRAQQLANLPPGVSREGMAKAFDERPVAEMAPRFGRRLIEDAEGSLWVQGYALPGDSILRWTVFQPDGSIQAELVVPVAIDIRDVQDSTVVAVMTDDFDVPTVGRFVIERSGTRR